MDVEFLVIDEDTSRDELIEALNYLCAEAQRTHPSPRYDALHHMIDTLLDLLVGR